MNLQERFYSSVSQQSRLLSNEYDAVTAHAGTTGATTWGHDIALCHRLAMVTAAVGAATSVGPVTAPSPTETADVVVMHLTGGRHTTSILHWIKDCY